MGSESPTKASTETNVPPGAARVKVEVIFEPEAKSVHSSPGTGNSSRRFAAIFVSQVEDALLTVGGLVAGISANFAPATVGLVVGGLVLAGVGKSLPSLFGQAFKLSTGPFPRDGATTSGWKPSGRSRDYNALVGDASLLTLTCAAAGIYLHSHSATVLFLALVGSGFVIKAALELVEEGRLAVVLDSRTRNSQRTSEPSGENPSTGSQSAVSTLQSATTEGTILLAFGLVALTLCWVQPTGLTHSAATALALAAVGKALPSFVSASSASSGK